ncbi:MAG: hypothetical protein WBN40_02475 [Pseudomonadales bacterium]
MRGLDTWQKASESQYIPAIYGTIFIVLCNLRQLCQITAANPAGMKPARWVRDLAARCKQRSNSRKGIPYIKQPAAHEQSSAIAASAGAYVLRSAPV